MRPRYIHIGAMNIEHFGKEDSNPDNQYALAEHIEMSGVHVLALQELYVTNDISDLESIPENKFLSDALSLVEEHTGDTWKYEIFRNRGLRDKSQLCGIAWNTSRVEKTAGTFRIPVSNKATDGNLTLNLWDRHPHAVKFKALPGEDTNIALTDFVVVSLHMKSNVGKHHVVMKTRAHEVREIIEKRADIENHFDEKDIIFIGDTNCKSRHEDLSLIHI